MKPFKAFPSHHPTPNGSHAKGWVRREWEEGADLWCWGLQLIEQSCCGGPEIAVWWGLSHRTSAWWWGLSHRTSAWYGCRSHWLSWMVDVSSGEKFVCQPEQKKVLEWAQGDTGRSLLEAHHRGNELVVWGYIHIPHWILYIICYILYLLYYIVYSIYMSPAGKPGRKFLYYGCGLFRPRVSPAKREHFFLPWGNTAYSFVFSFVGASRYITNMLLKRILSDMAIGRVPSSLLSVLFWTVCC
jgi:hypothetical protein